MEDKWKWEWQRVGLHGVDEQEAHLEEHTSQDQKVFPVPQVSHILEET